MDAAWLSSPEGTAAIQAAAQTHGTDPLAATTALRRRLPQLSAEQIRDALAQADLRRLAAERYGIDTPLLLTRDGLEQATRPEVAAHRARLLATSGARRVVDLTAGLGLDTRAFLAAGLEVVAVERDPLVASLLQFNAPQATVLNEDAQSALSALLADLDATDVVFVDPARRERAAPRNATGRAQPERDPERWSPPWSFIAGIAHPRVAVKVAPAFTPPTPWHAEWVSWHRTVVECAATSWPVFDAPRRAAVLTDDASLLIDASDERGEPHPVAEWLFEPDPAIIRAGAIDALARHGLQRIDDAGVWLTSDAPAPVDVAAAVRQYRVVTELTGSMTEQRRTLDQLGIASLTVKSKDAGIAPAVALRELRRREGQDAVLVLARRTGRVGRWLAQSASA